MQCDMHVHTFHSGMCTLPLMRAVCRESYTSPEELYERLTRLGMDLADFFPSAEATCRLPAGSEVRVGVYDITERQHAAAYLDEQGLFFSGNYVFSALTGRREPADFGCFEAMFPVFEARNGQMTGLANRSSAELASALGKAAVAGSDAHTLESAGSAWTQARGARTKAEFLAGLRRGLGEPRGIGRIPAAHARRPAHLGRNGAREPGGGAGRPALATLADYAFETAFARRWMRKIGRRPAGSAIPGLPPRPRIPPCSFPTRPQPRSGPSGPDETVSAFAVPRSCRAAAPGTAGPLQASATAPGNRPRHRECRTGRRESRRRRRRTDASVSRPRRRLQGPPGDSSRHRCSSPRSTRPVF
jgi:hypothetical protein